MGGLWHQSIKVTAEMMPCHSWRALRLMSVSGFWWELEGLRFHHHLPLPADESCSDRESCRRRKEIKADISAPSLHLVRVVLFCPNPLSRTSCSTFLFTLTLSCLVPIPIGCSGWPRGDCLSLAPSVGVSVCASMRECGCMHYFIFSALLFRASLSFALVFLFQSFHPLPSSFFPFIIPVSCLKR